MAHSQDVGAALSMTSNEIYERLSSVFRDVFDDESIVVSSQLTASDVPGWDSLTNIRLILTVEKTFGIQFSASEIGKLQNVGDLVSLVRSKS